MSHASHKIPVRRGNTALALCQNTHIAAQAGPAGRRADNRPGLDKRFQKALSHGLQIDRLRRRDHNAAHVPCDLSSLHNLGRLANILNPSIGTGSDHHLIDLNRVKASGLFRILRKMRE